MLMKTVVELCMDALEQRIRDLNAAGKDLLDALDGYLLCRTPRSVLIDTMERYRKVLQKK